MKYYAENDKKGINPLIILLILVLIVGGGVAACVWAILGSGEEKPEYVTEAADTATEEATRSAGTKRETEIVLSGEVVAIDATNFPDEEFRTIVQEQFDYNYDGSLDEDEIRAATVLDISNSSVCDITGIEYLMCLEELNCSYTYLTTIDLSRNTMLKILNCRQAQLTSLDLSKNTELEQLSCGFNALRELDLSRNTALRILECEFCGLRELDLSHNVELQYLDLCSVNGKTESYPGEADGDEGWNKLTKLDVRMLPKLYFLSCCYNQLEALDVRNNRELQDLRCYECHLPELDLSQNPKLYFLECSCCDLETLDVSGCPDLFNLYCGCSNLKTLDVSGCNKLVLIECSQNELTTLDLKTNTALKTLYCSENFITHLDLSNNPKIKELGIDPDVTIEDDTTSLEDGEYHWEETEDCRNAPNGTWAEIKDGYLVFYGDFVLGVSDGEFGYIEAYRSTRKITWLPLDPNVEFRWNAFESGADAINQDLRDDLAQKHLHITVKDGKVTVLSSMCGDW